MARKDPDFLSASVMVEVLESEELPGLALICGDPTGFIAQSLGERATGWSRRAGTSATVSPLPPEGPFDVAVLKIPKSTEELKYTVHLLAERLKSGGRLFVYGGNDEGIKSAAKGFGPHFEDPSSLLAKRHSRVWSANRRDASGSLNLFAFKEVVRTETTLGALKWTSWPGMFAHRRLDVGSAFLLEHLPELEAGARVLDYGCGAGVLSLGLMQMLDDVALTLFDNDALAIETALLNVPGAQGVIGTSLGDVGEERYDLILSNPPIHQGKNKPTGSWNGS